VEEFLADLRKMFRNCYTFHDKSSEYYAQAKTMEERLDEVSQGTLTEGEDSVQLTSLY
jgi:hypothetical protein